MADELRHDDTETGTTLKRTDWEGIGTHIFNSQAQGDLMIATSATQLSRLGITNDRILVSSGGLFSWSNTLPAFTAIGAVILAAGLNVQNATLLHSGLGVAGLTNLQQTLVHSSLSVAGTTNLNITVINSTLNVAGLSTFANVALGSGRILTIANDGKIQLGTLTGAPYIFGGEVGSPYEAFIQPKEGNLMGELGIMPSGTGSQGYVALWNASDYDNGGFAHIGVTGTAIYITASKHGTGTAPTSLNFNIPLYMGTEQIKGLGTPTAATDAATKNYVDTIQSILNDHEWSDRVTDDITAGENLVFGNAVYMKNDGKAWKADADAAASMPIFGIAVATINAEATGEVLTRGWIRDDHFSLTAGGLVYASVIAGEVHNAIPVGAGDQVQVVGVAKTTALFYFNPSFELVEIS